MIGTRSSAEAAARIAVGLGIVANVEPTTSPGLFGWLIQLGALGLLAWYFLRVEPQQRREEREARRRELELLLRWRDQPGERKPRPRDEA